MDRTSSRHLHLGYVLLIEAPYAIYLIVAWWVLLHPTARDDPKSLLQLALILGAFTFLFGCGARLSLAYLRGGSDALRQTHRLYWWAVYVGGAIPIAGIAALILRILFGDFPIEMSLPTPADQPFGPLRIGSLGIGIILLPLLLPLLHLYRLRR
ncbi:MAG: hypothetical protein JSS86_00715 [Cyanobacteria bacterium SZAS LIN-2]|nr:hypothetical protein [Cyanobacteria bacterium SZAS LIN-2]